MTVTEDDVVSSLLLFLREPGAFRMPCPYASCWEVEQPPPAAAWADELLPGGDPPECLCALRLEVSATELVQNREFVDVEVAQQPVVVEWDAMGGHVDPYQHDAPWASVPYGADPSAADSSDV